MITMKTVILLSLTAYAATAVIEPSPRSVNVALETSFLFEPKEMNDNIAFIKNIKDFLDKLYTMLAPQLKNYNRYRDLRASKQFRADDRRKLNFVDLFQEYCNHVANITLSSFDQSASVIKKEVFKMVDLNKSTLKHILPDKNIKEIMTDLLNKTHGVKTYQRCHKIPAMRRFSRKMDRIYTQRDMKKLHKYLKKFNEAIESTSKSDATKIVKEFIRFAIVDKYDELNETDKKFFVKEVNILLGNITQEKNKELIEKRHIQHHDKNTQIPKNNLSTNSNAQRNFGEAINTTSKPKLKSTNDNMETRKSIARTEKRVGVMRSRNDRERTGNNEIVVDNIELVVQSLKS
ncbi:hypothetical protein HW555_005874 [Spodoptera exigua]|uniref:Uncharacterized protein n=1 Tax=Spodoptera exigua TaxID=7107 RepID=A0A835GIY3_SPOEX|nr:hypothetical protein HW555_005874 [Spodoptera exigua]